MCPSSPAPSHQIPVLLWGHQAGKAIGSSWTAQAPTAPRMGLPPPRCKADPHHPALPPQSLPRRQSPPHPIQGLQTPLPAPEQQRAEGTRSLQTPHPTAPTRYMTPTLGSDAFSPPSLLPLRRYLSSQDGNSFSLGMQSDRSRKCQAGDEDRRGQERRRAWCQRWWWD